MSGERKWVQVCHGESHTSWVNSAVLKDCTCIPKDEINISFYPAILIVLLALISVQSILPPQKTATVESTIISRNADSRCLRVVVKIHRLWSTVFKGDTLSYKVRALHNHRWTVKYRVFLTIRFPVACLSVEGQDCALRTLAQKGDVILQYIQQRTIT